MSARRPRILFVAEGITLAQMTRLRVLAAALDPTDYEVHFACSAFPELVFGACRFQKWPIASVAGEQALRAAERGRRIYDVRTLVDYAREETRLFDQIKPDLVVGDLRLSLVASAPARKIRLATLINAYWSPRALRRRFPLPDHPLVDWVGPSVGERYFPLVAPSVFRRVAAPVNELRRRFDLPPIGSLFDVLTFGDDVLFPDVGALVPLSRQEPRERYLGPLTWSPSLPLPAAWEQRARDRPSVYVTLGSSGRVDLLPVVLESLRAKDVRALVATAGRRELDRIPPHISVAPFVPGDLAARGADLVISNGGSSTGYQALQEGTPVVGIPTNLDHYLSMTAIEEAGAGILVRSGIATAKSIGQAVDMVLSQARYRERARELARAFRALDAPALFRSYVAEVTGGQRQ